MSLTRSMLSISFSVSWISNFSSSEAISVSRPKAGALTDKQITSLIAAQTEMDAITDKLPEGAADKPDPKLQAQMDAIVKKNGFADFNEYGAVYDHVSLVISGIDPKTKAFTEPPEMLKKQMAAVQADTKIPAKDKKAILDAEEKDIVLTERVTGVPLSVIKTPYIEKIGTKAGPIGRWMLQGRTTKHWMRAIYSFRSAFQLRDASVRGASSKDYWQAGKSVAAIGSIEKASALVDRFRAAI